jgi:hypothetical protein
MLMFMAGSGGSCVWWAVACVGWWLCPLSVTVCPWVCLCTPPEDQLHCSLYLHTASPACWFQCVLCGSCSLEVLCLLRHPVLPGFSLLFGCDLLVYRQLLG